MSEIEGTEQDPNAKWMVLIILIIIFGGVALSSKPSDGPICDTTRERSSYSEC